MSFVVVQFSKDEAQDQNSKLDRKLEMVRTYRKAVVRRTVEQEPVTLEQQVLG